MKARVFIFYKESVFDPQGNTLAKSLQQNGFNDVKEVRMGKVIDVVVDNPSREEVKRQVTQMCEQLFANPVIESYRVEVLAE